MIGGSPIANTSVGSHRTYKMIAVLVTAESTAEALQAMPKTYLVLGQAESSAEALDGAALFFASLGIAEADLEVLDATATGTGSVSRGLGIAEAIAEALDLDAEYLLEGTPELIVSRSGTTATIKIPNKENNNVQVYRADGYRNNFSKLTLISSVPYDDTGLDSAKNYKYKVSFVVEGTKGGSAYRAESRRSNARYTKGG